MIMTKENIPYFFSYKLRKENCYLIRKFFKKNSSNEQSSECEKLLYVHTHPWMVYKHPLKVCHLSSYSRFP